MFKKILSLILTILILNLYSIPVYSADKKNTKIKAEFMTKLNVNKASDGEVVQLISLEDFTDETGITIPHGTIFKGYIKSHKESHPFYVRAKAHIVFDEMILPDGRMYKIKAGTKRKYIKGSAIGNTVKGIVTFPLAVATSAVGGAVMVVEIVTVIGLIFVAPTSNGFFKGVKQMTRGVNCKKRAGSKVKLKIKDMKEVHIQEDTFIERKNYNGLDK